MKTPFRSSTVRELRFPVLPLLSIENGLYTELVSGSLRLNVVVTKEGVLDPFRPTGKFSSMGDNEVGSKADLVGELEK